MGDNSAECDRHVTWAKNVGVEQHADWYKPYDVEKTSSRQDFQCALFWISWHHRAQHTSSFTHAAPHHGCPRPCGATVLGDCDHPPLSLVPVFDIASQAITGPQMKVSECVAIASLPKPTECECDVQEFINETSTCAAWECKKDCPSSLSPVAIALIVLLVLAIVAAVVYFLFSGKEKAQKKKKRAIKAPAAKPAEPPPAPEPVQPLSFTMAPPVYTTMMQPVHTTAMPMVQYAAPAQPMQYAAPAQPMQYAVAQPQMMQYAVPAYQQGQSLFDALDTNHDGVISRNEMSMIR